MRIPLTLFKIHDYRDFYDIPRLILATDDMSRYWIFDCAFDDELDEYPSTYSVYFLGTDAKAATEALSGQQKAGALEGIVPVSALEFDESKRHSFTLRLTD